VCAARGEGCGAGGAGRLWGVWWGTRVVKLLLAIIRSTLRVAADPPLSGEPGFTSHHAAFLYVILYCMVHLRKEVFFYYIYAYIYA